MAACGWLRWSGPEHGGPVEDQVSLTDALRRSVTVAISGGTAQPFLHPASGTTLAAPMSSPADIQAYEYGSAESAEAKGRQIRPDGSGTATTVVDWISPPHFFLKGRILVLCVGNDAPVLSLLRSVLGPQFAGVVIPLSQKGLARSSSPGPVSP